MRALRAWVVAVWWVVATGGLGSVEAQPPRGSLEEQLRKDDPAKLVSDARSSGDAARGALLFYQPYMTCAKCHASSDDAAPLGPDLSRLPRDVALTHLVESILDPSRVIEKGFETITVALHDGKTIVGLLARETPAALIVRDPARENQEVTLDRATIEEVKRGGASLMPPGLVNQLAGRGPFLDLLKYVLEMAEQGPARALALRPPDSALVAPPLPDYEHHIDHAGMIASLDSRSLKRGEAIYQRVCMNCHGTKNEPGSLPTSLRFASGAFKNGSDPFQMYQTITRGYGMMAAQSWMVPEQKYDVIHYIRETLVRPFNPGQYVAVDSTYLDRLPKGNLRGPAPAAAEPWARMDYGPSLNATIELGKSAANIAYKGIAVRLDAGAGGVAKGRAWVVYEHDTLRLAGGWTGEGFIDWNGINFNGRHQVHPRAVGSIVFSNPTGPGWANPETGSFEDPRLRGRDGRPYGPLPRAWAHFRGTYRHGDRVILAYTVGDADVLECSDLGRMGEGAVVFGRTLEIGRSSRALKMRVAPAEVAVERIGGEGAQLANESGYQVLTVPAEATPMRLRLLVGSDPVATRAHASASGPPEPLEPMTHGGRRRWSETLTTQARIGRDDGPFAIDTITDPIDNPWNARIRFTGFDFEPGGQSLIACTWDGDVWRVAGIDQLEGPLTWQRIASGLFQPLGVRIVDGAVHVGCRDQIVILRDLNGDHEADFYENFNSDHQVTEHFHEFAMDLETDAAGNFYYLKAARHGLKAVVPQHGTLLKVDRTGGSTEIMATGFRAPNGVCLNPDGSFFVTDQEGFWHPKNRINRVVKGGFYGNMWGYTDVTDPSDGAMERPVCWITNGFDRSPGQMLWVDSDAWAPLKGSVLNLSYGMGQVFVVPWEMVDGQAQGGMVALPGVQFPTGVHRGRFHPRNGQLYLCGMFAWAGNQEQPGGFYRLRYTGKPLTLPVGLHARRGGVEVAFSGPVDRAAASNLENYAVSTWDLKRTERYGSPHYNEKILRVATAKVSDDGRTVFLAIPDVRPTWCMEISYAIRGKAGERVVGRIDNTIYHLREDLP